jgi:hypothetical protein
MNDLQINYKGFGWFRNFLRNYLHVTVFFKRDIWALNQIITHLIQRVTDNKEYEIPQEIPCKMSRRKPRRRGIN